MKFVKWFVGMVVALVAVLALGSMVVSPQFKVTRSVTINAPADQVYALIADPRRWKDWAVWNQRDPSMEISYAAPPAPPMGAGAGWAWKSKSEGDGRMSFTEAEAGKRLGYELFFPDFDITSKGELLLVAAGNGTQVNWVLNGDMGRNPLFRWMALFMDGWVGKDFEAGLANLKALAEKP